jgi:response regulator RpfG family c-di-GMP phosphodiesterase
MSNGLPWKILIVDDDEDTHDVTEMALRRLLYEERPLLILHAFSAFEAKLRLIEHPDIAIALLDVVMENDTAGLDLVKTIRQDMKNDNIRLILRTGNPGKAPEEGVTLAYDINDYRGKTELTAQSLRTAIIIALRSYQAVVTIKNLHKEIDDTQKELIYTLGEIAESRSLETGHHVKRVSVISAFLAEKLDLPDHRVSLIGLAASMHDLGKMAIDDRILNKPGKLTMDEFEIIKKHCALGYEILRNSQRELLQLAAVIAYEHHENYDGSGYPRGLHGDEISLESRIVALVDVYDALSIKRVYKESWPREEILEYMRSQSGIKFDPHILEVFFENLEELEAAITLTGLSN